MYALNTIQALLRLSVLVLCLLLLQAAVHWYGSGSWFGAAAFRRFYDATHIPSGKAMWVIFDLLVPSLLAGFAAGCWLGRAAAWLRLMSVVLVALVVVALIPFYPRLFELVPPADTQPLSAGQFLAFYFQSLLLCAFGYLFGSIVRTDTAQRREKAHP